MSDCEKIINKYHDVDPLSMTTIVLGPCSPFSVTSDLMIETAKYARKKGVMMHTHLCETKDEEEYFLKMLGKCPLAYMEHCGWVGKMFLMHMGFSLMTIK